MRVRDKPSKGEIDMLYVKTNDDGVVTSLINEDGPEDKDMGTTKRSSKMKVTNIGKTKEQIVFELFKMMIIKDHYSSSDLDFSLDRAKKAYDLLVSKGILKE